MIAILSACGAEPKQTTEKEKTKRLSIVTTVFPPYDFAKAVGGEYVDVTMLLSPGMESHSYEPTPQDIIKINESDLFIYVGGESDTWVESILDSLDKDAALTTLTLMDCVETVEEEAVEGMETEKQEMATPLPEYDEHVWTSPRNAQLITEKIAEKLCSIDTEHRTAYEQQKIIYLKELSELDHKYQEVVNQAVRKELVFGDRFPFRYLVDAYGLSYYAAFPGCSSETEPSAATIAFLTDKVKEDKIPLVLYLELSNHTIADAIAESTGTQTAMLHSCHNISAKEAEAGVTYLSLMQQNLEVLKGALY
ncbi:MAG: metal ABC transporter substrate-binding protein [Lachnospiraceae bacterium]